MFSFLRAQKPGSKGVLCVQFAEGGVAVAHVVSEDAARVRPKLLQTAFLPCPRAAELDGPTLSRYVRKKGLKGALCDVVLSPSQYHLLLIDRPNVEESEVKQAAYFLTKDLIDLSMEDAAIDTFNVPVGTGKPAKIYVVVTSRAFLTRLASSVKKAGLELSYINIAELALSNLLAARQPMGKQDVALIFAEKRGTHLAVFRNQDLRFTRKLGMLPAACTGDTPEWRAMLTEVQRSLDYYQTEFAAGTPQRVFVVPDLLPDVCLKQLAERLLLPVKTLDLASSVKLPAPLNAAQQSRLLLVSAESLQMEDALHGREACDAPEG